MVDINDREGMLSPYRVLDLTDEKGVFCGKILGDLGADVIKIERPGGDSARNIGPFYHDEPDPEKSLSWFAFNTNKRGITLNIESPEGQIIFKRLMEKADFLIESFNPGYLDGIGLGYSALEKINRGLIMVSITPFGQTGPYKDFKTSDIVAWAMGGQMYITGQPDRPPVRASHHSQVYLHTGAAAASGAMVAFQHRQMTGEGQQVDVSVQEIVTRISHQFTTIPWDANKVVGSRSAQRGIKVQIAHMWQCKDGYVIWMWWGGMAGWRRNTPVLKWMDEDGMLDDYLRNFNWETHNFRTATLETIEKITERTEKFFIKHTVAELWEGAQKRGAMIYPVATVADILNSPQLVARKFWAELEHPELNDRIPYPGAFVTASEASPSIRHRAPLIGEHNAEIYEGELGFSKEQLIMFKQAGII